jgi:NAD(P)-dependent dehydrogenase (short-subunit alcohol dehydrogenase family)
MESPFGWESTAAEVVKGVDLSGLGGRGEGSGGRVVGRQGGRSARLRAVVTGATSGIGVETARALAGAGAEVTLAVRDVDAGREVASGIVGEVNVARLDLSIQESVGTFVSDWNGPLDILINNAGVMAAPLSRTAEGWESQFATNYLGHFALTTGLHEALRKATHARVVSVSSVGHLGSDINYEDIDFRHRPYDPQTAYSQSKTATVLFAVEASRRWAADGITVNAVNPGPVLASNLMRHYDPAVLERRLAQSTWRVKTPEQGAATSVFVATSPLLEGIGGRYFEDCDEAPLAEPGGSSGVAGFALDPINAAHLWRVTEEKLRSA